jgi:hypothetical protein
MSDSTSTKLARLVEEEEDAVQRAIERGGLPTEAEGEAIMRDLSNAISGELESVMLRVEGIAKSSEGDDLPFTVSLEQIGVVAVLADDVERYAAELHECAARMLKTVGALGSTRQNQLFQAKRAAAS